MTPNKKEETAAVDAATVGQERRASSSTTPYIGSRVSLTTNSEVRYEGTLYTVDSTKCTIYLSKVRIFGTEDRPATMPIPPRDEIYDYIVFKASDIKDLVVCNRAKHSELFVDPAIVSCSGGSPPTGRTPPVYSRRKEGTQYMSGRRPMREVIPEALSHFFNNEAYGTPPPRMVETPRSSRRNPLPILHRLPTVVLGTPRAGDAEKKGRLASQDAKLKFDSDYDFAKANEQFQQVSIEASDGEKDEDARSKEVSGDEVCGERKRSHGMEEKVAEEADAYYDKSVSFFDRISCEMSEGVSVMRSDLQKRDNEETFGPPAASRSARPGFPGSDMSSMVSRPPPGFSSAGLTYVNGGGGTPRIGGNTAGRVRLGDPAGLYGSLLGAGGSLLGQVGGLPMIAYPFLPGSFPLGGGAAGGGGGRGYRSMHLAPRFR